MKFYYVYHIYCHMFKISLKKLHDLFNPDPTGEKNMKHEQVFSKYILYLPPFKY